MPNPIASLVVTLILTLTHAASGPFLEGLPLMGLIRLRLRIVIKVTARNLYLVHQNEARQAMRGERSTERS